LVVLLVPCVRRLRLRFLVSGGKSRYSLKQLSSCSRPNMKILNCFRVKFEGELAGSIARWPLRGRSEIHTTTLLVLNGAPGVGKGRAHFQRRLRGLHLSKSGSDLTLQCKEKKTSSENCTSILRSVTRDLARELIPHSRGCWSSVHDPRPFIPVRIAACGKAHLECQLTGEAH